MYLQIFKKIIKSKTLTKKEKSELIAKGLFENLVNNYKFILKIPFLIIGLPLVAIGAILTKLGELCYIIQTPCENICTRIEDDLPDFVITKNQARTKILNEIKNEKTIDKYQIKWYNKEKRKRVDNYENKKNI